MNDFDAVVAAVRAVCRALPETREEEAWVGTRWRVRTKTFAHVLTIDAGSLPWRADEVGLVLPDDPDADEIRELLTESSCAHAPAKLVALVNRPPD